MIAPEYYIGLMSGTSLDGVDGALVAISAHDSNSVDVKLLQSIEIPIPSELTNTLSLLCHADEFNLTRLFKTEVQLAHLFADAVIQLLAESELNASDIKAIGCHGITIRHFPNSPTYFSKQIGDGSKLAALTKIDVVNDFRMADVAVGGQGAPLVPPFHRAVFNNLEQTAVVNLGGIANITLTDATGRLIGFDTGPANTLLDKWCFQHTGSRYDKNGEWAATGKVNRQLLALCLSDPYFLKLPPKSTGKEHFNLPWLERLISIVEEENAPLLPQDVQATLLALTIQAIKISLEPKFNIKQLIVCGGGVHNTHLMAELVNNLPNTLVTSSLEFGVCPDSLEAMAFAWLAYCRVNNIESNSPSVTGAANAKVLGAWYQK
ncbi:anhydro-N-acetylmuramic acid kinase [Psychrosphaera sp. B3R10]|uniref:anhydro-N-acetylmuramic acid kinase n=1 Tax=unclassified Psychrosphaera TaxID=2641570 RepID=UPI001C0A4D1D|nr:MULTISPECIES: anhydro-N-acetylmuramic acid kinase [unclassified Psychrosphaera]MBU2880740.1 anhydro-N-acetylmuramic acid kinase [Psychrosphaera sp. I2R16]MBU2991514.1 anhydro-N-acetylmuramic acid kinase [Psychrosphaera sp. B3R10]MDO6719406.1 anhydro-N-acetylmuramic acid kinase [Psychrosphaera sp. 1_MG-2023]